MSDTPSSSFDKDVFPAELRFLRKRRERRGIGYKVLDNALPPQTGGRTDNSLPPQSYLGLVGLALSGGGIRSATFNLGILQAMAKVQSTIPAEPDEPGTEPKTELKTQPETERRDIPRSLLSYVDYLSTVSGGGYIGSWLTAWMFRMRHTFLPDAQALAPAAEVERSLNELKEGRANGPEPPAIGHLRSYSNYLTPALGFFSLDTWAAIAVYTRNLFLNALIVIPGIAALIMVPWLLLKALFPDVPCPKAAAAATAHSPAMACVANLTQFSNDSRWFLGAMLLVPVALWATLTGLQRMSRKGHKVPYTSLELNLLVCLPLALTFVVITGLIMRHYAASEAPSLHHVDLKEWVPHVVYPPRPSSDLGHQPMTVPRSCSGQDDESTQPGSAFDWCRGGRWAIASGVAGFLVTLLFEVSRRSRWALIWISPLISLLAGGLGGLVFYLVIDIGVRHLSWVEEPWHLLTWLPSLGVLIFFLSASLWIAGRARLDTELHREWLAAKGGMLLTYAVFWSGLLAVSFYGPAAWLALSEFTTAKWSVIAGWIFSLISAGLLGKSPETGSPRSQSWLELATRILPALALLGLLIFIATVSKQIVEYASGVPTPPSVEFRRVQDVHVVEKSVHIAINVEEGQRTATPAPVDQPYWDVRRVQLSILLIVFVVSVIVSVAMAGLVDVNKFDACVLSKSLGALLPEGVED